MIYDLTEAVGDYKLNEEKNMLSNLWTIDVKDVFKGLVTAIYGAILTYVYGIFAGLFQLISNGEPFKIQINFKAMLVIGAFAGLSYLMTRYTSDNKGVFLGDN